MFIVRRGAEVLICSAAKGSSSATEIGTSGLSQSKHYYAADV
jgi:hypothetical protein